MEFQTESFTELQEAEPVRDFLEVMNGPEDGKHFEITKDVITIGRLPENDFCIPLELSVSRKHARLIQKGDIYQLEILPEAKNPGKVMDKIVYPGETAKVIPGQVFALGNVSIDLIKGKVC
jgi:hypothetical protein